MVFVFLASVKFDPKGTLPRGRYHQSEETIGVAHDDPECGRKKGKRSSINGNVTTI